MLCRSLQPAARSFLWSHGRRHSQTPLASGRRGCHMVRAACRPPIRLDQPACVGQRAEQGLVQPYVPQANTIPFLKRISLRLFRRNAVPFHIALLRCRRAHLARASALQRAKPSRRPDRFVPRTSRSTGMSVTTSAKRFLRRLLFSSNPSSCDASHSSDRPTWPPSHLASDR